jgi:hypothetical protein
VASRGWSVRQHAPSGQGGAIFSVESACLQPLEKIRLLLLVLATGPVGPRMRHGQFALASPASDHCCYGTARDAAAAVVDHARGDGRCHDRLPILQQERRGFAVIGFW